MAELAPGLFVSPYVPDDSVFVLDLSAFHLAAASRGQTAGRGIAVSDATWERIPGADRERLIDEYIRRSAESGTEQFADWLATELRTNQEPEPHD